MFNLLQLIGGLILSFGYIPQKILYRILKGVNIDET